MYYNFRCEIAATAKQKFESELISNCIEVCYKEVDIKASKPASSTPIRYDTMFFSQTAMSAKRFLMLVA